MEVVVAVEAGAENKAEVPLKQLLADIWKTLLASLGAFFRWSLTSALHFPSAGESCLMPFSISDNEVKITAMQHQSGLILHLKRDMEGTGKKSLQINLTENASALSIPLFFFTTCIISVHLYPVESTFCLHCADSNHWHYFWSWRKNLNVSSVSHNLKLLSAFFLYIDIWMSNMHISSADTNVSWDSALVSWCDNCRKWGKK